MPRLEGKRRVRFFRAASVFFVLGFLPSSVIAQQKLNLQVSDTSNRPVKDLKITTKSPGSTETTDSAGKATVSFSSALGVIELVIVSPSGLDFISPWQRSVTVPPTDWSIVVATRGNREALEHPKVVAALAARANHLQARKTADDPPPSDATRQNATKVVAEEIGLEPSELSEKFDRLTAAENDPYDQAMGFLYKHAWGQAADLFSKALDAEKNPHTSESIEIASNSAFFLGQALFELGRFSDSAVAYGKASQFRPDDPVILNNEGLSLSKSGDYKAADQVYQRALKIMGESGMTKSLDYSTTTNNVAALRAYQGNVLEATKLFRESLDLRLRLLPPNDPRIATSLDNVAAMKILRGDCDSAKADLEKALTIQKAHRESSELDDRHGVSKAMVAVGPLEPSQRATTVTGRALASSTPGTATSLTNLAMVAVCKGDFRQARAILDGLKEAQIGNSAELSDLGNTLLNFAWLDEAEGNVKEADDYYNQAIEAYKTSLGASHPQVAIAQTQYGELLIKTGDQAKARAVLTAALQNYRTTFEDNSDAVLHVKNLLASLGGDN